MRSNDKKMAWEEAMRRTDRENMKLAGRWDERDGKVRDGEPKAARNDGKP